MAIANNKKAFHDFFIEDRIEAGLVLESWEVKAIRAARVQLKESYIYWKKTRFIWSAAILRLCPQPRHILNQMPYVRASSC